MAKYIDADELLNALQGQVSEVCNKIPYDKEVFTILHDRQMEIYNLIEKQPTADVVEVVRCADCKYQGNDDECPLLSLAAYTEPDDFCSYGKRAE